MNDLNISINPQLLDEKGMSIVELFKVISDSIDQIERACSNLSSWQSANKDKYEAKLKEMLPRMREMADVIQSYGNVAKITSRAILNTERIISNSMDA